MSGARWGVFLDRDGTLVPDVDYPTRPGQLRFFRRTGPGLRVLREAGASLVVVSNQSGVARGFLDADGLARMDRRLLAMARAAGAPLDRTYYCPHHPDWSGPCTCRKPNTGMIEDGLRDLLLPRSRCYLIGDTASDMEAGKRAGLTTVLVLTGKGQRERAGATGKRGADHISRDLGAAARWILNHRGT